MQPLFSLVVLYRPPRHYSSNYKRGPILHRYEFAGSQEELGTALFLPWAAWVCVWTSVLVGGWEGACSFVWGVQRADMWEGSLQS